MTIVTERSRENGRYAEGCSTVQFTRGLARSQKECVLSDRCRLRAQNPIISIDEPHNWDN
jgi:hypothetical protein